MGGRKSRIAGGLIALATSFGLAAPMAGAADPITPALECCTFEGGPYVQALGERPMLVNPVDPEVFGSGAPHDVVSDGTGPDGRPLFSVEPIAAGSSAVVEGTQYLQGGTYAFLCSLHPGMNGELVVDGTRGTVAPRPQVRVAVPAQRLRAVRRQGVVRVRVRAVSASSGAELTVRRGRQVLGTRALPNLAAGQSRLIPVRLRPAARRLVRRLRVLQVNVRATVPYGNTTGATRRVR